IAYQRMVIWSTRTRPSRSDRAPANQPPKEETTSVTVASNPASPVVMPHRLSSDGMTKLKIWTSKASSDQPPKQAASVRRSVTLRSFSHASVTLPPLFVAGIEARLGDRDKTGASE